MPNQCEGIICRGLCTIAQHRRWQPVAEVGSGLSGPYFRSKTRMKMAQRGQTPIYLTSARLLGVHADHDDGAVVACGGAAREVFNRFTDCGHVLFLSSCGMSS